MDPAIFVYLSVAAACTVVVVATARYGTTFRSATCLSLLLAPLFSIVGIYGLIGIVTLTDEVDIVWTLKTMAVMGTECGVIGVLIAIPCGIVAGVIGTLIRAIFLGPK
jgi:hypothetical protein